MKPGEIREPLCVGPFLSIVTLAFGGHAIIAVVFCSNLDLHFTDDVERRPPPASSEEKIQTGSS